MLFLADLSTIVLPLLRQQDGVGGQTREERQALREAHDARVFAHVEPMDADEAAHSAYSSSVKHPAGNSVSSRGTLAALSTNQPQYLSSSYRSTHSVSASSFPKPGSLRDRLLLESATHPRSVGMSTSFGRTSPVKSTSRPLPPIDDGHAGAFSKREVPRSSQSSFSGGVRPKPVPSNLSQRMQPTAAPVRNDSITSVATSGTITPRASDPPPAPVSPAPLTVDTTPAVAKPPVKEAFFAKLGVKFLYPFYAPRVDPPMPPSPASSVASPTAPRSPAAPTASPSSSVAPPTPQAPTPPPALEQARPISMPTPPTGLSSGRRSVKGESPRNSFTDAQLHGSGAHGSSPGMDTRLRQGAGAAPRWQRVVNPCESQPVRRALCGALPS